MKDRTVFAQQSYQCLALAEASLPAPLIVGTLEGGKALS